MNILVSNQLFFVLLNFVIWKNKHFQIETLFLNVTYLINLYYVKIISYYSKIKSNIITADLKSP